MTSPEGKKEAGSPTPSSPPPSSPTPGALPPGALYRWGWSFYLTLAVVAVVWVGWQRDGIALEVFLVPEQLLADLGLGLLGAAAFATAWLAAEAWLPAAKALQQTLAEMVGPLDRGELLALALLSGFAEELFFRGAVQGSLGLALASILFGLVHSGPLKTFWLWTVSAMVAGLALGLMVEARGTLLPAVVTHQLFNAWSLRRLVGRS